MIWGMNTAIAALIGLAIAIILIVIKVSPVYSLITGALAGGLLSGFGLVGTVDVMIDGVKDITPAILRILAAGVLSGALIKTGAAASISRTIVSRLGRKQVYLALALSAMLICGVGVFVDVAVITVAPIALILAQKLRLPKGKILLAMIGGAKCGNIISPNPNTIIAAENYSAPLSSVMSANIIPALTGLLVTVYLIVPLMPSRKDEVLYDVGEDFAEGDVPPFWASAAGPLVTVLLLALRPLFSVVVDPLVALPVGGLVCIIATRQFRNAGVCLTYGLEKMSVVAILLVGTGTIAGVIKASEIKDVLLALLSGSGLGGVLLAPVSGMLMAAATASTTAGATIASAAFASSVAGVSPVWAAAMMNASCTVLDHLPHGSFFHATGGSVAMAFKDRLRLVPFESLVGLVLTAGSVLSCLLLR